jgi:hypothetical protein
MTLLALTRDAVLDEHLGCSSREADGVATLVRYNGTLNRTGNR